MGKSTKQCFESFGRGYSPKRVNQLIITQKITTYFLANLTLPLRQKNSCRALLSGLTISTDSVRGDWKTFVIDELDDSFFERVVGVMNEKASIVATAYEFG